MARYELHERAAEIVRDAGGQLIGRTRLQKVAYLVKLAGFGDDFQFEYRHYGPFSEDLAAAMEIARATGLVTEDERRAEWGGRYSIYKTARALAVSGMATSGRAKFIAATAGVDAVELELAATAAFLYAEEGIGRQRGEDAWEETARRKPEKAAEGRLERAKAVYRTFLDIPAPRELPRIA